ncbi:MAG: hypothetical protein ACLQVW_05035 [Limisphaerales bacterium]
MRNLNVPSYLKLRRAVLIGWSVVSAFSSDASTLASVPMNGEMLMPDVWYHADTTNVTVDCP